MVSGVKWQRREEQKQGEKRMGRRGKGRCLPRPLDNKQVPVAIIKALSVNNCLFHLSNIARSGLSIVVECGKMKEHSTVH